MSGYAGWASAGVRARRRRRGARRAPRRRPAAPGRGVRAARRARQPRGRGARRPRRLARRRRRRSGQRRARRGARGRDADRRPGRARPDSRRARRGAARACRSGAAATGSACASGAGLRGAAGDPTARSASAPPRSSCAAPAGDPAPEGRARTRRRVPPGDVAGSARRLGRPRGRAAPAAPAPRGPRRPARRARHGCRRTVRGPAPPPRRPVRAGPRRAWSRRRPAAPSPTTEPVVLDQPGTPAARSRSSARAPWPCPSRGPRPGHPRHAPDARRSRSAPADRTTGRGASGRPPPTHRCRSGPGDALVVADDPPDPAALARWRSSAPAVAAPAPRSRDSSAAVPAWCRSRLEVGPRSVRLHGADGRVHERPPAGRHGATRAGAGPRRGAGAGAGRPAASTTRRCPSGRRSAALDGIPAPDQVAAAWATPRTGLVVALGSGPGAGPSSVDLVADGPHALVAGTTGAGKSELLTTLVLALALTHPPDRLAILLVDFKGGTGLGAGGRAPARAGARHRPRRGARPPRPRRRCAPSCVGARRARRRRRPRPARARPGRPRDAAAPARRRRRAARPHRGRPRRVRGAHPDRRAGPGARGAPRPGHPAAGGRGRRRPARERRAADRPARDRPGRLDRRAGRPGRRPARPGDARPRVGASRDPAARAGAGGPRGRRQPPSPAVRPARAVVATSAPRGRPTPSAGHARSTTRARRGCAPPRQAATRRPAGRGCPWLPALPSVVRAADVPDGPGLALARRGPPDEQRRGAVRWDPADGPLLVLGGPRSGRTTTLVAAGLEALDQGWAVHTVGLPPDAVRPAAGGRPARTARAARWRPTTPARSPGCWSCLAAARPRRSGVLLLVDRLDLLLDSLGRLARGAGADRLTALWRGQPAGTGARRRRRRRRGRDAARRRVRPPPRAPARRRRARRARGGARRARRAPHHPGPGRPPARRPARSCARWSCPGRRREPARSRPRSPPGRAPCGAACADAARPGGPAAPAAGRAAPGRCDVPLGPGGDDARHRAASTSTHGLLVAGPPGLGPQHRRWRSSPARSCARGRARRPAGRPRRLPVPALAGVQDVGPADVAAGVRPCRDATVLLVDDLDELERGAPRPRRAAPADARASSPP